MGRGFVDSWWREGGVPNQSKSDSSHTAHAEHKPAAPSNADTAQAAPQHRAVEESRQTPPPRRRPPRSSDPVGRAAARADRCGAPRAGPACRRAATRPPPPPRPRRAPTTATTRRSRRSTPCRRRGGGRPRGRGRWGAPCTASRCCSSSAPSCSGSPSPPSFTSTDARIHPLDLKSGFHGVCRRYSEVDQ